MGLAVRLLVPRQRVGVAIVGFREDGRILMLQHVFHPVAPWGLPGGWLNRGESPAECAVRELEEETGLTADLGPVIHVSREDIPSHIGIAYMAKIKPGPIVPSSEILDAAWYPIDSLPKPILPFETAAIQAALSYPSQQTQSKRASHE